MLIFNKAWSPEKIIYSYPLESLYLLQTDSVNLCARKVDMD